LRQLHPLANTAATAKPAKIVLLRMVISPITNKGRNRSLRARPCSTVKTAFFDINAGVRKVRQFQGRGHHLYGVRKLNQVRGKCSACLVCLDYGVRLGPNIQAIVGNAL
jgi:hypothetical protein